MKICIAGLTASGKTYQAKRIAAEFGLEYVSGSNILLQIAKVVPVGEHFWVNEFGLQFREQRTKELCIDRKVDELILQIAETKRDVIFDSWTLPWLYKGDDLYRIYLAATLEARAKNAYFSRDTKPFSINELQERINEKDEANVKLFRELYGIDITDPSVFELIVHNSDLEPEEVSQILITTITLKFGVPKILIKEN